MGREEKYANELKQKEIEYELNMNMSVATKSWILKGVHILNKICRQFFSNKGRMIDTS